MKLGYALNFESPIELDFLHLFDQDPSVTFFQERPVNIEYEYKNFRRFYTPDFYVIQDDEHYLN